MIYKIFADLIVTLHFVWVLFMLFGFIITLFAFFRKEFFDKWLFRTIHALGIIFVSILAVLGQYCPLTLWENILRARYDPSLVYAGSCIIHYVHKLLYPDISPLIIRGVTTFISLSTIVIYIIKPPAKIKTIFKGREI